MMRENLKFWILASALVFFASFPTSSHSATLSGPERPAEVGHLQKWKSDIKGSWMVFPPDAVEMANDSDGLTLYFVPLRNGTLYVTFLYIQDGTIIYDQIPVPIGSAPEPDPEPEPSPSPAPKIKLTDREKTAAKAALEVVINGVENGTIKTPAGARSQFKQTLMAKGQVCNGRQCYLPANLQTLADDWTERTDFTTAETVKKSFETFLPEVE